MMPIKSNSACIRAFIATFLLFGSFAATRAQTRMILNGGIVNITQGAYLVIDNAATNAITRNSGHIISETANSNIRWNIGTSTGAYSIPWGYGTSDYIPVTFTKSAGAGSGHFLFATYHTPWNNVAQLPPGVTNINGASGADNSAFEADRFWKINAQGYTTKPDLTNLEFTYLDAENAAPNTIFETKLRAKRYNSSLNSWTDIVLSSAVNPSTNKVTVGTVEASNLEPWWTLGTLNLQRYWVAASHSTSTIASNWSETSGGPGNAGTPTIGDAVVFDAASSFNCTLDAALSTASLTINAGYLGTITQGSNTVAINGDATFSGGAWIGSSSDIAVNGNFLLSGTSLMAPSAVLDIKGNFSHVSGTFTHNSGTVAFSGTSGTTQNISSTSATTFSNITVTNAAASPGVRVESDQNLHGKLTLASNVTFDADGSSGNAVFKLVSTGDSPTIDASIAALPSGAQVLGKVTVQRFMSKEGPNGGRIYRYIASPIQNATVSDLQQEIPVTGSFTGRSICSGCTANASLFLYNEAVITDTDHDGTADRHDGYIEFPDISNTETFQPGKGYALFVRGNILGSTLWDLRGPINSGNVSPVSLPVAYTSSGTLANDGWNLVGNPFPSTIDWNAASGWSKTNIDASIYITDNDGPSIQMATWNGVTGTNGGSRYIATGQGFWVKASGAPVLQANENVKAAGTQTTFFREGSPANLLRITMKKGATRDEAVIHFRDDATSAFDSNADALKLFNTTFNLFSVEPDGKKLAINSIAPLYCTTAVTLGVENSSAGSYQLTFSELESFSETIAMTLADAFTKSTFDIRSGAGYPFFVSTDPASYSPNRFTVTFDLSPVDPNLMVSAPAVCEGADAVIHIQNAQDGIAYEASSQGRILSPVVVGIGENIAIPLYRDSLQTGLNSIKVIMGRQGCNDHVETTVELTIAPEAEVTLTIPGKGCPGGNITLNATGAPTDGSYNWYETESAISPDEQHASSFTTPPLTKTQTYYVAAVNSLGCEGQRKPVLAEVAAIEAIEVSNQQDSLWSNHTSGNQWYLNNDAIPGATKQWFTPEYSGHYGVEVSFDGCIERADYEFVITGAEAALQHNIHVFPNPVVKDVTVTIPDSFLRVRNCKLINGAGQTVRIVELKQGQENQVQFDMTNLPSGVYILRLTGPSGVVDVKLIRL